MVVAAAAPDEGPVQLELTAGGEGDPLLEAPDELGGTSLIAPRIWLPDAMLVSETTLIVSGTISKMISTFEASVTAGS